MPANSERRQEGTDDHAGDSGDLKLGHALYARHAHFPGISSAGSHIVRRIAQFNSGSSSLGLRLYRRWAGGPGSGLSWPDMEWLHAYRGDRTTAKSSSSERTPFSGRTKSYPTLEAAAAPIRSTPEAPAPIEPAASSTAPSSNQESFAQKGSGVGSDSPRSKASAPLAGASDGDLTPQAQLPIVSAHADQQNAPLVHEAESTPVVRGAQKIETHNSIERQQGKQWLQADANAPSRMHSKAPVYLGRAILQRSTERGRSEPKPNVSGPGSATGALPASANLNQQNPQLSSEVEPPKVVDAGQSTEKGRTAENQHSNLQLRASADRSVAVRSKQPTHLAPTVPQRSTANPHPDTKPEPGAAPISAGQGGSSGTHAIVLTSQTMPPVPVLRSTIRSSIVQGETAVHRRQAAEGPHSADSLTEHLVHPESGKSSPEPSLDAPRGDGNTQAIKAAAQPIGERQSSEKQASQLPLSAQSANHLLPAVEVPRKEEITRSIVQRPAPRIETVHLAQAKTANQSENGPDVGNIPIGPPSVPVGPIISSTRQSPGVANSSDARRQDMSSPATSAVSHTALKGLHATRSLDLAQNRSAPVFRSLALPGSGTPFTPSAHHFGAHLLQRHRESLITRLVDVGTGHNPDRTLVQPASALNSSENRVDLATARPGQHDGERGRAPHISNLSHVVSSAPSPRAGSQPPIGTDAVGDVSVHSGLEAASPAPQNAAQRVIQRDFDSAAPGVQAGVPVVREETEGGTGDGTPSRTHRIPDNSASHFSASSTLATSPAHFETTGGAPVVPSDSGAANPMMPSARPTELVLRLHEKEVAGGELSSNKAGKKNNPTGQTFVVPAAHGRPQAALHHLDRSAIHGLSTLEKAHRTHLTGRGDTNGPSVMVSRSPQEARAVSPSSTVHRSPLLIPPAAGLATLQEHDSLSAGAPTGSSSLSSVQGASVLNLVHRSPVNSEQDRMSSFRPSTMGPFRSVSLTHRAAQATDGLQRSPWSGSSASPVLARQSGGSPAPSAVPAAVPLPSASSSTYQAGKASQSLKNVDVGQLANRVYDLLVRRLASERQRRGL